MLKRIFYNLCYKFTIISLNRYLYREYLESQVNTYIYERAIEYSFALEKLYKNEVMNVLDIGTGTNAFAATLKHCGFNVTASDKKTGYWHEYFNRHIYVVEDDITHSKLKKNSFDGITCISVIEHIEDFDSAINNITNLLKPNGILVLTFPYTWDTFCDNVYQLNEADSNSKTFNYIGRSYSDSEINGWMSGNNLELIEQRYFKGWSGKFWRTGHRLQFPIVVKNRKDANGICLLFKKGET